MCDPHFQNDANPPPPYFPSLKEFKPIFELKNNSLFSYNSVNTIVLTLYVLILSD